MEYRSACLSRVKLLVADLGAKNHMINMFRFNGFYGCHLCTAPCKTIGKTHAQYPVLQNGDVRKPSVNNIFVEFAQLLPLENLVNVVGVKGKSALAALIDGLPLTAPIDYMHCILLGVFPDSLILYYRVLSHDDKNKINQILSNRSCPLEFVAYSRKIRPLDETAEFKANEYFNWIFYVSPIVFMNRIPSPLFAHLLNIVFVIRLILESSVENVAAAEIIPENFFKDIVSMLEDNELNE